METELERPTETAPSPGAEAAAPVSPSPYDLVVLGATEEAVHAARLAARRGRKVGLILPDIPACLPAVAMQAAAAALRQAARTYDRRRSSDFAAMVEAAQLAQASHGRLPHAASLAEMGFDVLRGDARFAGPDAVEVDGVRLPFRRAILATGRAELEDERLAARSAGYLDEAAILELTDVPKRLAIVGTGPAQCAWAQTFCHLGSQVYLLGWGATVLPEETGEVARLVEAGLSADGVSLHLGCEEIDLQRTGASHGVLIRQAGELRKLFVDQVLVECPRRPNVESFALDRASVACGEAGVVVDDTLRTSNPRVFAVGDVCGEEFSSRAVAHWMTRVAVRNSLGWGRRKFDRRLVPRCTQTEPQVVRFGWTTEEAARRGIETRTYQVGAVAGEAASQPVGLVEVHVRDRTGRLVGATIVSGAAAELAGPLLLLLGRGLPLGALGNTIPWFPASLESLHTLVRRCRRAQPLRPWSGPLEWFETMWRRARRERVTE